MSIFIVFAGLPNFTTTYSELVFRNYASASGVLLSLRTSTNAKLPLEICASTSSLVRAQAPLLITLYSHNAATPSSTPSSPVTTSSTSTFSDDDSSSSLIFEFDSSIESDSSFSDEESFVDSQDANEDCPVVESIPNRRLHPYRRRFHSRHRYRGYSINDRRFIFKIELPSSTPPSYFKDDETLQAVIKNFSYHQGFSNRFESYS